MQLLEELIPELLVADFQYLVLIVSFVGVITTMLLVIGYYILSSTGKNSGDNSEALDLASHMEWRSQIRENFLKLNADEAELDMAPAAYIEKADEQILKCLEVIAENDLIAEEDFDSLESEYISLRETAADIFENEEHVPYPNEVIELKRRYQFLYKNIVDQ